jgi:hypothetical protein
VLSRPRLALTAVAAAATLLVAGCGGVDSASAAGITHDDLVSELANGLADVSTLNYTATYQLAGGDTATLVRAQRPARLAYTYPGGRLIVTPAQTVACTGDKKLTCTRSAADPTAAATLTGTTLVTPEAALAMLNAAALDPKLDVLQHDTTVAGRHANCLDLSDVDGTPANEFSICVTNEGALAVFTATIQGERVDQALTAFSDKPDASAFSLPPTAHITTKPPN